jgi:hypothetical protein
VVLHVLCLQFYKNLLQRLQIKIPIINSFRTHLWTQKSSGNWRRLFVFFPKANSGGFTRFTSLIPRKPVTMITDYNPNNKEVSNAPLNMKIDQENDISQKKLGQYVTNLKLHNMLHRDERWLGPGPDPVWPPGPVHPASGPGPLQGRSVQPHPGPDPRTFLCGPVRTQGHKGQDRPSDSLFIKTLFIMII